MSIGKKMSICRGCPLVVFAGPWGARQRATASIPQPIGSCTNPIKNSGLKTIANFKNYSVYEQA